LSSGTISLIINQYFNQEKDGLQAHAGATSLIKAINQVNLGQEEGGPSLLQNKYNVGKNGFSHKQTNNYTEPRGLRVKLGTRIVQ
jgi:hypothetical protein